MLLLFSPGGRLPTVRQVRQVQSRPFLRREFGNARARHARRGSSRKPERAPAPRRPLNACLSRVLLLSGDHTCLLWVPSMHGPCTRGPRRISVAPLDPEAAAHCDGPIARNPRAAADTRAQSGEPAARRREERSEPRAQCARAMLTVWREGGGGATRSVTAAGDGGPQAERRSRGASPTAVRGDHRTPAVRSLRAAWPPLSRAGGADGCGRGLPRAHPSGHQVRGAPGATEGRARTPPRWDRGYRRWCRRR